MRLTPGESSLSNSGNRKMVRSSPVHAGVCACLLETVAQLAGAFSYCFRSVLQLYKVTKVWLFNVCCDAELIRKQLYLAIYCTSIFCLADFK